GRGVVPRGERPGGRVGGLGGGEPVWSPVGLGAHVASEGTRYDRGNVRRVVVVAGGEGDFQRLFAVVMDYEVTAVDGITADTVCTAIPVAVAFTTQQTMIPDRFFPDSAWLEPGLPLRLRADRPALPAVASPRAARHPLLKVAGLLPPSRPVSDALRAELTEALAEGIAGGADAARAVAARVVTVHDLRGLALALREAPVATDPDDDDEARDEAAERRLAAR